MKTSILTVLMVLINIGIHAQVAINEDNANPDPSAMLDVKAIDKGVLVPRLTTTQRTSISSPANGLLVFDSQTESFWFYVSGTWTELRDSSNGHVLSDADGNTKVDVEENANEDIVRIKIAGKDVGYIDSTHMDLIFPDSSTIIGHLAGNENAIITNPSSDDQGKFNTFVGLLSGYHNNPDPYDCYDYIYFDLYQSGCGSHNTFLGNKAGLSNINGRNNLFIGSRAGLSNRGEYIYNIGEGGPGSENTFLGFMSGQFNANGYWNTFVGAYSGEENGRGIPNFGEFCSHNTYIGVYAGRFNRDGRQNTYIGTEAGGGWDSDTGERNVYIGRRAGYGNTGDENVFVGTDAGYSYQGDNFPGHRNTYIGHEAGYHNAGSDNVFIGNRAGYYENGNNKLYIANDDTGTPLIYGDFDQQTATIHGFLGIGTTSPTAALEVAGNASIIRSDSNAVLTVSSPDGNTTSLKLLEGTGFGFEFEYDGATNVDKLYLHSRKFTGNEGTRMTWLKNGNVGIGTSSPDRALTIFDTDNTGGAAINIKATNSSDRELLLAVNQSSGGIVGMMTNNDLYFRTNGTNRMVIENNGEVGIGTTNPTALLEVNATVVKKIGGGTWTASSDRRLKKDISEYDEGLEKVLAIHPVNFHYNKLSGYDTKKEHIGVIAQELQEVAPYMVSSYEKDGEEYLQVDNSAMTYMLINAVKEQQEMIESQHKEILALKVKTGEVDQLKVELENIKMIFEMRTER